MSLPDYSTALSDVRTALTEIENIITIGSTAYEYALDKQAVLNYWTNLIRTVAPIQDTTTGTDLWIWNLSVVAVYRAGNITEIASSVEKLAQETLFDAVYEFTRRPYLQSPSYVSGVQSVNGVIVNSAEIVSGGTGEQQTLNVVISMTIPLLLDYNTLTEHE